VDFALVSPLVMLLVLALIQLALVLHARSVVTAAAEDAVRVAVAYDGGTSAGDARLRSLLARDLQPDLVQSTSWSWTLDTLTLKVQARLPFLGLLAPTTMTTYASAYRETWP
jgi:hypothetical protein